MTGNHAGRNSIIEYASEKEIKTLNMKKIS